MSKISTFLFTFIALLFVSSCAWVDDDYSNCPTCPKGCKLQLSYIYNMLNAEAVSSQVKNAQVLILDKNDSILKEVEVDSLALSSNDYTIDVSSLSNGNYSFLVWCGIDNKYLKSSPYHVSLTRDSAMSVSYQVPSLFYGKTELLPVNVSEGYTTIPVRLVKDTKTISCTLQSDNNEYLQEGDFDLSIESRNGVIDSLNTPSDDTITTYKPFYADSSSVEGYKTVTFGINSLRLLENDNTRLVLTYRPTGNTIVDLPLSKYLLMFKNVNNPAMVSQEYLDREDTYNLIFLLTRSMDGYMCCELRINGWIVRLNEMKL